MMDEITDIINLYALNPATPGLAFMVSSYHKTIFKNCIGSRNDAHELIGFDSKFRIASITKQFTAVAILQCIENGKLRLDTRINTILKLGQNFETITVKHLLTHTSGLPDYERLLKGDDTAFFTDEDVYDAIRKMPYLDFEPGSAYHYSNTAYCLLAVTIAKLTGMTFKDYIKTYVFKTAGMNSASVGPSAESSRVYGYASINGWTLHDQSKFTTTQGDGGIYASASDLISWQHKLYETKSIITPESLSLMTASHAKTNYVGESYGFGVAITNISGETCYLHHGETTGFENALFYLPKLHISIVLLANFSATTLNTVTLGKQIIVNHLAEIKNL